LKQLAQNKVLPKGDTINVALIGSAGTGKSTFINSFLGVENLARAGDFGESCTQVVSEYVDVPTQSIPYRVEVILKAESIIMLEIREHFEICATHYAAIKNEKMCSVDEDDAELEQAEIEEDREKLDTAEEYLCQLFGSIRGFQPGNIGSMMKKLTATNQQETQIKRLQKHCKKIIQQCMNKLQMKSEDIKVVEASLSGYTRKANNNQDAMWPLVQLIRFHINSPILRQGFTIADCPGLSDVSLARREATKSYLRNCSMVLVLANIDRIATDPATKEHVRQYTMQKGPGNVILLATRIDDVTSDPPAISDESRPRLQVCHEQVDQAQKKLASAPSSAEARAAVSCAKAKLKRQRILMRNDYIMPKLCEWKDVQGLIVFPISSHVHLQYMRGIDMYDPPPLNFTEDNIGRVRAAICTKIEVGRLQTLRTHIYHTLRLPITRLLMVLKTTPSDRQDQILALLYSSKDFSDEYVMDYRQEVKVAFKIYVESAISKKLKSEWSVKMGHKVDEFRQLYKTPASLKAFSIRSGRHKPGKSPVIVDWNDEMLIILKPELDKIINDFEDQLGKVKEKVKSDIILQLDRLRDKLCSEEHIGGIDLTDFMTAFRAHHFNLKERLDNLYGSILNDLREVLQRECSEYGSSIFKEAMSKIFQNMYEEKFASPKKGVTTRRWEYLKGGFCGNKAMNPVPALQRGLADTFTTSERNTHSPLCDTLHHPFNEMIKDMNLLFKNIKDGMTEEEKLTFENILASTNARAEQLFEQAEENLKAVEEWSSERKRAQSMPVEDNDEVEYGLSSEDESSEDEDDDFDECKNGSVVEKEP